VVTAEPEDACINDSNCYYYLFQRVVKVLSSWHVGHTKEDAESDETQIWRAVLQRGAYQQVGQLPPEACDCGCGTIVVTMEEKGHSIRIFLSLTRTMHVKRFKGISHH
jgi:hypothetical protein